MMTDNQKHLYAIYQRILTLCNEEKQSHKVTFSI